MQKVKEEPRLWWSYSRRQIKEYNQNSVLQKEVGNKLLETICLKQGDTVLDLGCGTGYLASVASQKVGPTGKIVAVDPDLERILIAQEKYHQWHHLKNTSISEGSSDNFPAGPYDAIYTVILYSCGSKTKKNRL